MDKPIRLLEHTDEATKQMLENVRKRKIKFDTAKRWHYLAIYSMLLFAFLFFSYFYFMIAKQYSYSFFAMFSASVSDAVNIMFVCDNSYTVWGNECIKTTKG